MACSNCNTPNCGCSGTYVVSQTCPPACSEVFNSACIVYTGVDLTCTDPVSGLTSTIISRNDYLDTALTALVNYICARFNPATIPSSVVVSGDSYVVVDAVTVGYVTTYTVTLDPAGLPTASIVTAGDNVVVTGDGSAGDPYVVNSHESIVDVTPGTALSVSTSSTGPYENTYTIDIDSSLLPVTELQTSFGHISITEIPNTPNAGDTTYTLEVDEVTISTSDAKLDVVLTNAGGVAPFERTFTVDIDDTEMGNFIMDTAGANIVAAGGITVAYDAIAHQITIGETIGVPDQWKIISDSVLDITAGSPTDKLNIVAGTGTAVTLVAGVNEGTFTIDNTDLGSDQLIFGSVDCNNGGPSVGTATAATNTDTLTMVGGDDITLGVAGNTITINNDIDNVYSDVIADSGGSLQAATTTATLEVLGGTGISTAGVAGPTNSITINNDGVTSAVAGDGIAVSAATGAVTVSSTDSVLGVIDVVIAGGAVTSPAAGAVSVVAQGINSAFMQVALYEVTSGTLQNPADYIIDQMGLGAGTFRITNGSVANGSYKLTVVGNRV